MDVNRRQFGQGAVVAIVRIAVNISCLVLAMGASIVVADQYESDQPLVEAVRQDDAAEVRRLLESGADVSVRDGRGATALFIAVYRGNVEMARLLLEFGANVHTDGVATTLLETAAGNDSGSAPEAQLEMVRLLLEAGASVHARGAKLMNYAAASGNEKVLHLLLEAGASLDRTDSFGRTALHLSGRYGEIDAMRLLLKVGADPNIRNRNGDAVLHEAVSNAEEVRMLLEADADANIRDRRGNTALHLAAMHRDAEPVRLLLEAGADVDMPNWAGDTAVLIAAAGGNAEITRLLLEAGADINVQGSGGDTALSSALRNYDIEMVRLLLEAGADAYSVDAGSESIVDLDVLQRLIEARADMDWHWDETIRDLLRERFQLYNACKPIDFVAIIDGDSEPVAGITKESLQAAIESRLRVARMFDAKAASHVRYYVHVVSPPDSGRWTYQTELAFRKSVRDIESGQTRLASTWSRGSTGYGPAGSRTQDRILAVLRGYMDEFLAEYLRVNAKACQ